jgi:hypothetical protein
MRDMSLIWVWQIPLIRSWFRAISISPNKYKYPNEVFQLRLWVMLSQCAEVLLTTYWSGTC